MRNICTAAVAAFSTAADPDWDAILAYLPEDWESTAKTMGAFTRARSFENAGVLLRTLFLHLAEGCSLRETAVRAKRSGLADVSDVAIMKRLRASEKWLHYLATSLAVPSSISIPQFRLCMVDATVVSEPGSTGTDWRLHYMLEVPSLTCRHFELTDKTEGESFRRFPIQKGDLLVGDRCYCGINAIRHVKNSGGDVVVRVTPQNCSFFTFDEKPFNCLAQAAKMKVGQEASWPVIFKNRKDEAVSGRLCVYRLEPDKAKLAQRKAQRESERKNHATKPETLDAANYVVLFTTVDENILSLSKVFEIYRLRWQIELAFKRLKSITGFGHLPKHDPVSCRAWLYGKLLVGLLIESMIRIPFSP